MVANAVFGRPWAPVGIDRSREFCFAGSDGRQSVRGCLTTPSDNDAHARHRVAFPPLSFIDVDDLLVFARFGRRHRRCVPTCHCMKPASERAWLLLQRDRRLARLPAAPSSSFTRSPLVAVNGRERKYLISFALPRFLRSPGPFAQRTLLSPRQSDAWIAKLDTVVHELYHIDPEHKGIRKIERGDGTYFTCLARSAVLRAGRADGHALSGYAPSLIRRSTSS